MLRGKQKVAEVKLLLGDYVTINMAGVKESQVQAGDAIDNLVKFENLFEHIVNQRGDLQAVKRNTDSVIEVGNRRREILQDSDLQTFAC